ncbi:MAG: glutaminase A [Pseudomonadales bacterium]|jgi:glutaminase|nr:glutaminase A [Pseudomonadales bacterium]
MAEALEGLAREALDLGRAAAPSGKVATYIPELGRADPGAVALAIHTVDGDAVAVGDVSRCFTLQSVSKVFALAALLRGGDDGLWEHVRQEPSGDAFHSIVRLEEEGGRPRNPFINAGAIVVSGRLPGVDPAARAGVVRAFLREAAASGDEAFAMDEAVYRSECRTGFRNRALANFMCHHGVLVDPDGAADGYFRQCALTADVDALARAGLFLAAGGLDPHRDLRLLDAAATRTIVALMGTCGLYDEVGSFAVRVGVPGKSGVSGAILAIVPGRMSIACFGPALGVRGNSVAGLAMLEFLARELSLSVFDAGIAPP